MKPRGLLVFAVALAACGKPEPKGGKGMAVYEDPGKRFSCAAPEDWRVRQKSDGATFFGPPGGPAPFTASVAVSIRPGDAAAYQSAQAASGGLVTPLVETAVVGRKAFAFQVRRREMKLHSTLTQEVTVQTLAIPVKDGVLVVAATANPGGESAAEAALESVVNSLKLP